MRPDIFVFDEGKLPDFAVIFDSDGVVVDSEPFSLAAFREAMAEQGVLLNDGDVMANCGLTDADICQYVLRKFGKQVDVDIFHARKQELYEQKVKEGRLEPCEGVEAFLLTLRSENIPYALASSGSPRKIRFNLKRVGLLDRFPAVISGEHVKRGKPQPDIFLLTAKRLGVPCDRCIVIEDSLNGIEAAHRAGMICVAVAGTFTSQALSSADFVVDSLAHLRIEDIKSLMYSRKNHKGGSL